jgi:membrane protease YdiL (CAAX protease family)
VIVNTVSSVNRSKFRIEIELVIWQIIIVSFLFLIPSILGSILAYFGKFRVDMECSIGFRYLLEILGKIGIMVAILCFLYSNKIALEDIGLPRQTRAEVKSNIISFGIIFGGLFFLSFLLLSKNEIDGQKLHNNRWPQYITESRTKIQRFWAIICMYFSCLSEELLFRGFIVIFLGLYFNHPFFIGIISVILSILAHLYQGKEYILYHLLFSILIVRFAFESKDITLCFLLHTFINYISMIRYWHFTDINKALKGNPAGMV